MPKYAWILDVLADLKCFASANGLMALAEQLEDTRMIATEEIEALTAEARKTANGKPAEPGQNSGGVGGQQHA